MNKIIKLTAVLIGFIMLSGCATCMLNGSNTDYKNSSHKEIKIVENCFVVNVFKNSNSNYYEIIYDSDLYYIRSYRSNDYVNLVLVDELPKDSNKIGESTIHLMSKRDFDRLTLAENDTDFPKYIYIVTEKSEASISTESDYLIYYMSKNGLTKQGPVSNRLSQSAAQRSISTIRNAGYVVTVPFDIAISPLFVVAILGFIFR